MVQALMLDSGKMVAVDTLTIENVSSLVTDYVIQPVDILNKMIRVPSAFGTTTYVSIPNDANLAARVGTSIIVSSNGTGIVVLRAQTGAVVHTPQSLTIDRRYGRVVLIKVAANTWEIDGQLVAQAQLNINPISPKFTWLDMSSSFAYPLDTDVQLLGCFSYDGISFGFSGTLTDQASRQYYGLAEGSQTFANVSVHGKYMRATVLSGGVTLIGGNSPPGILEGVWAQFLTGGYYTNPMWRAAATWAQCQPPYTPAYTLRIDVSDTPDVTGLIGSFTATVMTPVIKHVNQLFITNHDPAPLTKLVNTYPTGTLLGDTATVGVFAYDAATIISGTLTRTFRLSSDLLPMTGIPSMQLGISKVDASAVDQSAVELANLIVGSMVTLTGRTSFVSNSFIVSSIVDSGIFYTVTLSMPGYLNYNPAYTAAELCDVTAAVSIGEVFTHPEFPNITIAPWYYKVTPTSPLPFGVTSTGTLIMGTEYTNFWGTISLSGAAQTISLTVTLLVDTGQSIQPLTSDTFNLRTDGIAPVPPAATPLTLGVLNSTVDTGAQWYSLVHATGDLTLVIAGPTTAEGFLFTSTGVYVQTIPLGTTTIVAPAADTYYLAVATTPLFTYDALLPWSVTNGSAGGLAIDVTWTL